MMITTLHAVLCEWWLDLQSMSLRTAVRGGLVLLAVPNLAWGSWATLWPRHFFDTFPGFGFHWTAAYPPYNHHLIADLGASFLTLGALLAIAIVLSNRTVTTVVLIAAALFGALHLRFHVMSGGELSGPDQFLSVLTLIGGAVVPLALLAMNLRSAPD